MFEKLSAGKRRGSWSLSLIHISPTIISCVQLGATVDYAILMSSRFQEELRKGKDRMEAIRIAADSSDASIVTSALVLFCATLGVSFVSSIDLIGAICIMLARGALISALVSIFLMPTILCVCEPLFSKTSLHWRTDPPAKPARAGKALAALAASRSAKQGGLPAAIRVGTKTQAAGPAKPAEECGEGLSDSREQEPVDIH